MDLVDILLLDIILKFYAVASWLTFGQGHRLRNFFVISLYQILRWIKLNLACW